HRSSGAGRFPPPHLRRRRHPPAPHGHRLLTAGPSPPALAPSGGTQRLRVRSRGMGLFQPGQGEVVRADLTSPMRTLTFPVLELTLVTGLSWMLIGWLDQPGMGTDPQLRNAVVLIWAALAFWRFALP